MQTTQRRRATVTIIMAAALFVLATAPRADAAPARTGTVLVAVRPIGYGGPTPGCYGQVDCLAWQQTCTRPPSQKFGVTASIVNVRSLAAPGKERRFRVVRALTSPSPVVVELFDDHCRALRINGYDRIETIDAKFEIPGDAKWMTVTAPCGWLCTGSSGTAVRWGLW